MQGNSLTRGVSAVAVGAAFLVAAAAQANEMQFHICAAGQNLGQASSRAHFFAGMSPPPPAQLAAIAANLTNAASHIMTAETMVQQPFATTLTRKGKIKGVLGQIANYGTLTAGRTAQQKANYVKNIYGAYRNALSYTFVSSRPDAFQWNPTCDSTLLKVNWHLGRATTAAAMGGRRARSYQGGANNSAAHAVTAGLNISSDGRPGQAGGPKKILCGFNTKAVWDGVGIRTLQPNSPHGLYASIGPAVLEICRWAGQYRYPPHPPSIARIDGAYRTDYGNMTLRSQGGGKVAGTYATDGGRVFFSHRGNRLDGQWVERSSAQKCATQVAGSYYWGRLVLEFDPAYSRFQGIWGYCNAPPNPAKKWSGTRSGRG